MRKIVLNLLVVMLVCSLIGNANVKAAQGDTGVVIINVDPGEVKPILGVVPGTPIPELSAGGSATLKLPIKNNSSHDAKNVVITLDSGGKADFPFVYDDLGISQKIDKINASQTGELVFELDVDQYATEGRHMIKLNYAYSNTMGNDYTTSELISVKIVNKNSPPKLTIGNIGLSSGTAVPGQKVNLNVRVKNMGTLDAKDIKVTLLGLKNDEFTLDNFTDTKYIAEIKGSEEAIVPYVLMASKNIAGGNHSLEVKMEYKDNKKNAYSEVSQIFIPAAGKAEEGKPAIVFENIQYPVSSIKPGSDFPIGFDVANKGQGKADNIKIWLTADKEIISKSLSTIMVDTLDKGQTKKVDFNLSAIAEAETKNYPIALNIEYDESENGTVQKRTLTQYIGIYIENEGTSKSVPKIIVDRYSFEPSEVKAGENFQLKLSFLNTNRLSSTSNVKITISSDDGTFLPVNTSSTFYIESIGPRSNAEKVLTFNTKSDAAPKQYLLNVSYEYEDDKGTSLTAKDVIGIPVSQVPRLVTGEIVVSPEAFIGQPVPVTAEFFNMGKSTLYNLMIKAEGDFQVQGSGYFVGNFDPGKSDVFDATVVPNAAGAMKGSIVFTFEDNSGKTTEIKKEFTLNAMEMPQQTEMGEGMPGIPEPEAEKKLLTPLHIAIGAGVLVILVVIFIIVIRKKIKARRELTLDE